MSLIRVAPGHVDRECALRQESLYKIEGADSKLYSATTFLDDGLVSDRIEGLLQVDGLEGVGVLRGVELLTEERVLQHEEAKLGSQMRAEARSG